MPQFISNRRGLVLALGLTAAATIAACDSRPTEPTEPTRLTRVDRLASVDSTECAYGWILVNGVVVCNDPE